MYLKKVFNSQNLSNQLLLIFYWNVQKWVQWPFLELILKYVFTVQSKCVRRCENDISIEYLCSNIAFFYRFFFVNATNSFRRIPIQNDFCQIQQLTKKKHRAIEMLKVFSAQAISRLIKSTQLQFFSIFWLKSNWYCYIKVYKPKFIFKVKQF